MKRILPNALTAVLVACALAVTGLLIRRELRAEGGVPPVTRIADPGRLASAGSMLGSQNAPVRIVEFSDFQCPSCARSSAALKRIQAEHPGLVTVVYRHFPIGDIHPHAFSAAIAAECASEHGRFQEYHDALFQQQDSIGTTSWLLYAEKAGVSDLADFGECMRTERPRARVDADTAVARSIGVWGTPAFIFQGKMVTGASSTELLSVWIRDALRKK
jgi:protein-disulfide isomerase